MSKLVVGDRVAVYGEYGRVVGEVTTAGEYEDLIGVVLKFSNIIVHRKQCRKLVKKPKRRIFLSTNVVNTVFSADHHGIDFNVVSIGKVPWDHSCVEFVEVIRKK